MAAILHNNSWHRYFVFLGSLVLVIAGLWSAQKLLIPIVLAALLTFILSPPVNFLQRHGLGRVPSVILVVTLAFGLVIGLGGMLLLQAKNLPTELRQHREQIVAKIRSFQQASRDSWLEDIQSSLQQLFETIETETRGGARGFVDWQPLTFKFESPGLMALVISTASPLIELSILSLLVIILVAFMLIHRESWRNRLIRLSGHGSLTSMTRAIDDAARRISRFLLMQLIVNLSQGAILGFGLFLIGVPYPVLWGFLSAILRYIPYLGIWISAILPLLLSIAILPGWAPPLLVFGLYLVVEIVNSNIVEPLVYGHSIGVSEVALLISAAFWGWLWGPLGLVLSTPLTACLVVIGRYVPHLEFFSILLGDEPVLAPHVSWYQRLVARDEHEASEVVEHFLHGHSAEETYERVLLPGLALARGTRERGELTANDEQSILRAAEEAMDELVTSSGSADKAKAENTESERLVAGLGCPARDHFDELALRMFKSTLPTGICRFDMVSSTLLFAEIVAEIEKRRVPLIVIATLSPTGLPHTRYLVKRLHGRFPDLRIFVGCWGFPDLLERTRKQLHEAGVDHIGLTLAETRQEMIPQLRCLNDVAEDAAARAVS